MLLAGQQAQEVVAVVGAVDGIALGIDKQQLQEEGYAAAAVAQRYLPTGSAVLVGQAHYAGLRFGRGQLGKALEAAGARPRHGLWTLVLVARAPVEVARQFTPLPVLQAQGNEIDLADVLRSSHGYDVVCHAVGGHADGHALLPNAPTPVVIDLGCDLQVLCGYEGIIDYADSLLQIVVLYVQGLQGMHGVIERCGGLQVPVPHARAYLHIGAVVVPKEQARAPAVAILQLVLVPHLPDAFAVDGAHELSPARVFLYIMGFAVLVYHLLVDGAHVVEGVSLHVFPRFAVDGPEVLGRHHLAQALQDGQGGRAVLGVEAVHSAAALGARVLVVAHGVDVLIGAAVVNAVALRLHLVGARAVELLYQFFGSGHGSALVARDVEDDAGVVAYALDGTLHVRQVERLVKGVARVACHKELLPYHQAQFIAKLVEEVALNDSPAPQAQEVDAALGRVFQLGPHAAVVGPQHGLGNPVTAAHEHLPPVDDEELRFVGGIAGDLHLADAEARLNAVAQVTLLVGEGEPQGVHILRSLVLRPPQTGVANDELWVILGRKYELLMLPAHQFNRPFEGDAGLGNRSMQGALEGGDVGVVHLHGDGLAGYVVLGGIQGRADHRGSQLGLARGVESHATPNARVAVAYAVLVAKVPAHAHQHSYVLPYPPVASVMEFVARPPAPLAYGAGEINGEYLHGYDHLPLGVHPVCDVYAMAAEHTGHHVGQPSVYPYLGPVVDARGLHPDATPLEGFGNGDLRAEPVGIEVASGLEQVGYEIVLQLVVLPIVRLGIYALLHQVAEYGARHNGLLPAFAGIAGRGYLRARAPRLAGFNHLPYRIAAMEQA